MLPVSAPVHPMFTRFEHGERHKVDEEKIL